MKRRFIVEMETELSSQNVANMIKLCLIGPHSKMKVTNVKLLLAHTLDDLNATTQDIDLEEDDKPAYTIEPSNDARR